MSNHQTKHQTHTYSHTKEDIQGGHQPLVRIQEYPTLIGLMIEHVLIIGIFVAAAMAIGSRVGQ